jgi:hypothetical protein
VAVTKLDRAMAQEDKDSASPHEAAPRRAGKAGYGVQKRAWGGFVEG